MIAIETVDVRVAPARTRLPFRYGIAEMTAAPHVVVEVTISDAAGGRTRGWASEHLPPKWFTKNPDSSFADDLVDLVAVVEHAAGTAPGMASPNAFALWLDLDRAQSDWARERGLPGLLSGLGTALVERAVIDAVCRAEGIPFVQALRAGALGFAPEQIHPELAEGEWRGLFPERPATRIGLRHTVALADPLTDHDVVDDPADGLPVSLASVLATQRARFLKVKTAGDPAVDRERLATLFDLCRAASISPRVTIDGNESMRDGRALATWIDTLLEDPVVGDELRESLIAVEQPIHRDAALDPQLAPALGELASRGIAVIVDESDDDVHAVRRAMDLGYAGGTYKGCKGVFRGLANGALVAHRRAAGMPAVLTVEDLSTLPPLTVGQDLVVAAAMGIEHIERNGHHFFGRLAPVHPDVDRLAVEAHPDLYASGADGRTRLRIDDGAFDIASILAAPFGFAPEADIGALPILSYDSAAASI